MLARVLIILFCFIGGTIAAAEPPVSSYQLDNGLTVVLAKRGSSQRASVQLWFRAGALQGPEAKPAVAHLTHSLLQQGTKRVVPGQHEKLVELLAGQHAQGFEQNAAWFSQDVPARHIPFALQLEQERISGAVIQQSTLTRLKTVMKGKLQESSALQQSFTQLLSLTYGKLPGTFDRNVFQKSLDAITNEDIRDFHKKHYRPRNAILVVVGDFDTKKVKESIKGTLGSIQDKPFSLGLQKQPQTKHTLSEKTKGPPILLVGFALPSPGTTEYPACQLWAELLGRQHSPLASALSKEGLAVNVVGELVEGPKKQSFYSLFAQPAQGKSLTQVKDAIASQLNSPRKWLSPQVFQQVRSRVVTRSLRLQNHNTSLAKELAESWIEANDPLFRLRMTAYLSKLSYDDFISAGQFFTAKRANYVFQQ